MGNVLKFEEKDGTRIELVDEGDRYRVRDPKAPPMLNPTFKRKDRAKTEYKRQVEKYINQRSGGNTPVDEIVFGF